MNVLCKSKKGGVWLRIPLVISVPDFCAVEFKEGEPWYETTKHFVGDQRLCPPPKGVCVSNIMHYTIFKYKYKKTILQTVLPLHEAVVHAQYDIASRVEEGEYKGDFEIYINKKKTACFTAFGEVKEVYK